MLKRLIATLIIKNDIVVQSAGFHRYLPIGKPEITVEFLNSWGIDEIIILDIDATKKGRLPNLEMIRKISKKCFVPLTVGGGIKSIEDAEILLQAGADKVSLNYFVRKNPDLITNLAAIYGDQFVVVSLDVIKDKNGYKVYDYREKKPINTDPFEFAELIEKKGAGELFVNAVHRDGMYSGYDIELMNRINNKVNIPVIACGGAKHAPDILALFNQTDVSAASASNFFNFYEHSVTVTKGILAQNNIPVRNESYADYSSHPVDDFSRLLKKEDKALEDMRFVLIKKEVI